MRRFTNSKRGLQGVILVLAAIAALAVVAPPDFSQFLAGGAGGMGGAVAGGSSALAAADMDDAAKALAKLDDDWSKAAATRDVERIASFYAEDAMVYPPNEPAVVGRAAAKKMWAALLADPSASISWKPSHAEVCRSGELGYTAGTYEFSIEAPDGKTIAEKGKYLCNWKKQSDGTWKAIHDMWNADAR